MHLGQIAAEQPGKAAVIMAGSGQTITFAELNAAANRLAHVLYDAGLRPGDHIAFMLENRWEFLAISWAAQRSGLYYTPVSSRLQADELAYIVDDCGAKVFIASEAVAGIAVNLSAVTPHVRLRLMLDSVAEGFTSYEEVTAAAAATPLPDETEGADMLYSSGTTGRPKGVQLALPLTPMGTPDSLYQLVSLLFPPDADSVYLSPAPLYHAAPLRYCLTMHRFGATVVVLEKFDPERALAAIETYRVTHSQWVPTMFIRMLKLPAEIRAKWDLSSLRYAVHAAAPCPIPVKERMIDWWGPVLHEYYSGTEAACFTYVDSADWLTHKGTVGQSLVGEPHVCDTGGEELPPGTIGTLYFSGGPTFEYHGDAAKTAASRDPRGRGWATLGDVGYLDQDGFLYLTDRVSHMIISGGVNVYPQEAENLLAVHPKVADVAVIGVPDPDMGEQVKAVVQPVSMADAGTELAAELIAYCRDRLAHYKCPRSVDFRADLPRHPTGKLFKRVLRDEYARMQETPMTLTVTDAGLALTDPSAYADEPRLHEALELLRREAPVHWVEAAGFVPFWAITRHADIMEIERNHALFHNAPRPLLQTAEMDALQRQREAEGIGLRTLIHMDDPQHRVVRAIGADWFRPKAMRAMGDRIGELARRYVDRMAALGDSCDFVQQVAVHYPLYVIMSLLGLPESDFPRLLKLTQELFGGQDEEFQRGTTPEELLTTLLDFFGYFQGITNARRETPTDDLASAIANARVDGEFLSDIDVASYYVIIATAGHDTTSSTISGGLHALIRHPGELARLRDNPALLPTAVDEMIRWVTPVKEFMRTATADTEVGGVTIKEGEAVLLSYPSGNRDEEVFTDPFHFDVGRDPNKHLAFGFGVHYCLGAALARMETRALFAELLPRLESIELAGPAEYTATTFVGGLKHLPIGYSLKG